MRESPDTQASRRPEPFGLPGWTVRVNHGFASVVEVGGELTRSGIDFVTEAIYAERQKPVVVDLADCGFIDAAGVALLRTATRSFARHGQPLLIAGARGRVERTLALSGISSESYPSAAQALQSLTPEEVDLREAL